MSWRDTVLSVMRVPPAPAPPPGSESRLFRAAPAYLTLRTIQWGIAQAAALFGLFMATGFTTWMNRRGLAGIANIFVMVEVIGWIVFVSQFLLGIAVLRLDFELRWYMVSDRALRIREGITTLREKTMTLANIQNLAVRQGPLQRLLGIADVEVTTAGGGAKSSPKSHDKGKSDQLHIAYFRGVDNAEEIRDLLRAGVRKQKDSGLGDLDDLHHAPVDDSVTSAVEDLLSSARELRAALEPGGPRHSAPA